MAAARLDLKLYGVKKKKINKVQKRAKRKQAIISMEQMSGEKKSIITQRVN